MSFLACASCAMGGVTSELDGNACGDGIDNDSDGAADCADSECQALELCRAGGSDPLTGESPAAPERPDAGSVEPLTPPIQEPPMAPRMPPSAPRPSTPANDPDAPDDEPPVEMPPPSCEPSCDEEVAPGLPAEVWEIGSVSVTVPRSKDLLSCFDTCLIVLPSQLYWGCGCPNDPFVRISLNGVPIGETSPALKRDAVVWITEFSIALESDTANVITLQALDYDLDGDLASEQLIFGCDIEATREILDQGTLRCEKDFPTNLGTRSFGITATVELDSGSDG